MLSFFEKKRFVLFLASIFFVSLGSFAQIEKERNSYDGYVYYETTDTRKRGNYNRSGVQTIDGRQVVPNEYRRGVPLSGTNGKYFIAAKDVGEGISFDALYDSNGNCIIPYTRQYHFLRVHEGWVEVYRMKDGILYGACNIYTGEELLPPIYDLVTESDGKIRGKNKNSRGEWITVATCEVSKKSSSHYTSSNTSTSRSSKSSSSSSSRQWVPCFFCDGTGNCPDCGGTGMRSTPFGMFQCSPKCGGCGGAGGSWTGSEPTVAGATDDNTINSDTNYQRESRQGKASQGSKKSSNSNTGWYKCCADVSNLGIVTYHTCANCGKSHQRGSGHMCKRR